MTYASLSACDEVVEVMEAVGASERVLALLEQPPAATVSAGPLRLPSRRRLLPRGRAGIRTRTCIRRRQALACDVRGADVGARHRVAQVASGERLPAFSGRVELRDVSFSYVTRPNHQALAGVNLTLQPGQLVALVGLSGSGKVREFGESCLFVRER